MTSLWAPASRRDFAVGFDLFLETVTWRWSDIERFVIATRIKASASALINAARNTGGSIGVSVVSNVLTHREQFHQNRLVEQIVPSSAQYQGTLQQVTNYFTAHGSSLAQAHDQAIQWIGAQVQAQASFLGYIDAFFVLMLISLSAVPLVLALRNVKLGGPVQMGH